MLFQHFGRRTGEVEGGQKAARAEKRGDSAYLRPVRSYMKDIMIGVISDTHYPEKRIPWKDISRIFCGVDLIIHAGDMTLPSVIEKLSGIAPVEAVCGNSDRFETIDQFPRQRIVTLPNGQRIGVVHHYSEPLTASGAVRCFEDDGLSAIVFGHTHLPFSARNDTILFFNPGAPARSYRTLQPTVGVICFSAGSCDATHILL